MFSFRLPASFVASFADRPVDWGFADAGGNALGEITFIRTYSRMKEDGSKERWHEVCERVINGMFSIQKDHAVANRLPWSDEQATQSAMEAFERMFTFKWLPPGRGLWMMGTSYVMAERNSASLQNCAFRSTGIFPPGDPAAPFSFLQEASMLGIGVGFDTKMVDAGVEIYHPDTERVKTCVVADSRAGWVESTALLINSYLLADQPAWQFDYSQVRPAGTPIKGFGGTASGPEPLIRLHDKLRAVFDSKVGQKVDTELVVDIANLIGVCTVAGNVRRSALLALGQPDDTTFVHLKDPEWFPERNSFDPDNPGWGWMSNNSVEAHVGMDYRPFLENVALNGEPGFIWLDVTRDFGRTGDAPDYKDHRVAGFNPCVTADTWVLATDGPRQVRDLVGRKFSALVDAKPYETLSDGFWLTGVNREVFDVLTDSGFSARVTANHQFMTSRGWVQAGDLVAGDELVLNEHVGAYWQGDGDYSEGYLLGHLWGDGTLKHDTAVLSLWGEGERLRRHIEDLARSALRLRADWTGFSRVAGRDEWRLKSADLASKARSWGMAAGAKKITDTIESASWEFYRGFLQAAFDTDGHVEGSIEKGVSVRLSQVDRGQLERVQRMLARMGVLSKIRPMHPERRQELPGGTFTAQPSWRLIVSGEHAQRYMELIGFADSTKTDKWLHLTATMTRGFYRKDPVAVFTELRPAGFADVYDVTVADVHAFDANGLYVHNCAEQPLEGGGELCTLVEVFLNRHDDLDDFLRTLKFSYMYGKTVTLLPTHWPDSNAIMQRNRRIGCSISGIAAFADTKGLPELRRWMDDGYHEVQRWDDIYSEWLCVRPSIRTTTVKPSGSVSILAGSTPGVHWSPGGRCFLRAIRFASSDPMVELFQAAGYKVEDDVVSAGTKVVYFPVLSDSGRSEREVSIFEKVHLAAFAQQYWSDNGVSVTVSFDAESEAKHLETVLHMHEGKLKTTSFLPQGNTTYPQMPYQSLELEEYRQYRDRLAKVDFSVVYDGLVANRAAEGEAYCTTDACELPSLRTPGAAEFEDTDGDAGRP